MAMVWFLPLLLVFRAMGHILVTFEGFFACSASSFLSCCCLGPCSSLGLFYRSCEEKNQIILANRMNKNNIIVFLVCKPGTNEMAAILVLEIESTAVNSILCCSIHSSLYNQELDMYTKKVNF